MTARRGFEMLIWRHLLRIVRSAPPSELLEVPEAEVQEWTPAQKSRYARAVERVKRIIGRHSGDES